MATSFFDMAARKAAANGSGKSNRTEEQKQHRPWVEKYRPKTMEEVASQDATVQVLKKALQLNNVCLDCPRISSHVETNVLRWLRCAVASHALLWPARYR